ncbi:hypothetical protein L6164_029846 [Bauhinia variegata]|uniref:Uncharacterized protein n=1 Tax=Bauhinia variegata TaxID=167791 RepID=A0ACB9LBU5_BAUVA|nr:hypothetical protein L6164_029846 [Bauhinia variegata]
MNLAFAAPTFFSFVFPVRLPPAFLVFIFHSLEGLNLQKCPFLLSFSLSFICLVLSATFGSWFAIFLRFQFKGRRRFQLLKIPFVIFFSFKKKNYTINHNHSNLLPS